MATSDDGLDTILERIRTARNLDLRSYKRRTLRRRIERRMSERRCRAAEQYLRLLERSPEELDALVSSVLVQATTFFRDPEAWARLEQEILPELLARKGPAGAVRIWSGGCATGEEAYSIAMAVAEALGAAPTRCELKVFATDVDEAAIAFARRGVYSRRQVASVPRGRLERFFVPVADGFAVHDDLRRTVVFGTSDLVADAPISRLDLLLCRNVLVYLAADLQKRILWRFHRGLRPGGILFLGRSELVPFAAKLYEPVDLACRIYRRGPPSPLALADAWLGAAEPEHLALRRGASRGGRPRGERLEAAGDPPARDEELETTAEALRTAKEELRTAHQALRSANEELETATEELKSANAELDAASRELAHRTAELSVLSSSRRAVVRSVSAAVIGLDPQGRITLWNPASERLLGLTEAEALGQRLWTLRIPVVTRDVARRMRRDLGLRIVFRVQGLSYARAAGGRGHLALTAVPLVVDDRLLGAVVVLEDAGRAALLDREQ